MSPCACIARGSSTPLSPWSHPIKPGNRNVPLPPQWLFFLGGDVAPTTVEYEHLAIVFIHICIIPKESCKLQIQPGWGGRMNPSLEPENQPRRTFLSPCTPPGLSQTSCPHRDRVQTDRTLPCTLAQSDLDTYQKTPSNSFQRMYGVISCWVNFQVNYP